MEAFPTVHLLQVFISGISSLSYLEIHLFIGGNLSLERDKGQGEES